MGIGSMPDRFSAKIRLGRLLVTRSLVISKYIDFMLAPADCLGLDFVNARFGCGMSLPQHPSFRPVFHDGFEVLPVD